MPEGHFRDLGSRPGYGGSDKSTRSQPGQTQHKGWNSSSNRPSLSKTTQFWLPDGNPSSDLSLSYQRKSIHGLGSSQPKSWGSQGRSRETGRDLDFPGKQEAILQDYLAKANSASVSSSHFNTGPYSREWKKENALWGSQFFLHFSSHLGAPGTRTRQNNSLADVVQREKQPEGNLGQC